MNNCTTNTNNCDAKYQSKNQNKMTQAILHKAQNEVHYLNKDKSIYTLELSVPGFKKEDFDLELNGKLLSIEAKHEKDAPYSWLGDYKRSYTLNAKQLDFEAIEVEYKAGILKINIKRQAHQIPQKRTINVQ